MYDGDSSDVNKIDLNLNDGVSWKDGLLIASNLRYKPSETSHMGISYRKDFLDAFFTNVVKYDTVQLSGSVRWADVEPSLGYLLRTERYRGTCRATISSIVSPAAYYRVDRFQFRGWGLVAEWHHGCFRRVRRRERYPVLRFLLSRSS